MAKTRQVQAPRGVRRMVLQIEVAQALLQLGGFMIFMFGVTWCDLFSIHTGVIQMQ
jgi:hypothetical protein